jgi:hypothetical protein
LIFSTANGNRVSISDADAGSSAVQVTLGVSHGTLTLSTTAGLAFSSGNGVQNSAMTFTGTLANINAALDGLRFDPAANYVGSDSLQIVTNDLGNTGAGGALSDTDTVSITVSTANQAPTLSGANDLAGINETSSNTGTRVSDHPGPR